MTNAAETRRLETLESYNIVDTPPEELFDDLVLVAKRFCRTPVALLSFVEKERQWFKAKEGFAGGETPIDHAICFHAIREAEILVVPDATLDARTKNNPLVTGDPKIRFYAGAVLRAPNGDALGTLCVIDTEPRPEGLSDEQADTLKALARQASRGLELRRFLRNQAEALSEERERVRASAYEAKMKAAIVKLGDRLRDAVSKADAVECALFILGETLGASRAGFITFEDELNTFTVHPDWTAVGQRSAAGNYPSSHFNFSLEMARRGEIFAARDIRNDQRLSPGESRYSDYEIAAAIAVPLLERGALKSIFFVHQSTPRDWREQEIDFVRAVADRTYAAVTQLQAKADQHLLNQELNHRLKNTLAMVQAIASQTMRGSANQAEVKEFNRRIQTLSTAHDVLLQQSWVETRIQHLMEGVLRPHCDMARINLDGPNITLGPRVVLSFSLLLHELATNALKYGALSDPGGKVGIQWRIAPQDGQKMFEMTWREAGGPPVTPPTRSGFGSRIIKAGLAGTGNVSIQYPVAGMTARFDAPLAVITES